MKRLFLVGSCICLMWKVSVGAMEQKPEHDLKEIVIRIEQLEKIVQSQQLQIINQHHKPEEIAITLSLQQLLELQSKTQQNQMIVSGGQQQPLQSLEQSLTDVQNGVQALRDGRPYNAWHYISSSGSVTATLTSLAGAIITLVLLLK